MLCQHKNASNSQNGCDNTVKKEINASLFLFLKFFIQQQCLDLEKSKSEIQLG